MVFLVELYILLKANPSSKQYTLRLGRNIMSVENCVISIHRGFSIKKTYDFPSKYTQSNKQNQQSYIIRF